MPHITHQIMISLPLYIKQFTTEENFNNLWYVLITSKKRFSFKISYYNCSFIETLLVRTVTGWISQEADSKTRFGWDGQAFITFSGQKLSEMGLPEEVWHWVRRLSAAETIPEGLMTECCLLTEAETVCPSLKGKQRGVPIGDHQRS